MKLTVHETAAWLVARDEFLIVTHRRPDGDTLGSAAALALGLRRLGKTAVLFPNPETTERYREFTGELEAPPDFVPRHIVSVDTASAGQYPLGGEALAAETGLCIDHHASNTGYAQNTCLYPEKAACGEVVHDLLQALSVEIEAEIATLLYIAVSTDTGLFAYANTTADTLRCAAGLIDAGAANGEINRRFFRTKAKSRILLESMLLNGLEFWYDERVAVMTVTLEMLEKTGATEDVMEDIAAIPGQIEGVLAGITVRELVGGDTKISVRTTPGLNASALCAEFGGGGHPMAAGCGIDADAAAAKALLNRAVKRIWDL